jgi:hypothetical protein
MAPFQYAAQLTRSDHPMTFVFERRKGRALHSPRESDVRGVEMLGAAELIRRGCRSTGREQLEQCPRQNSGKLFPNHEIFFSLRSSGIRLPPRRGLRCLSARSQNDLQGTL